METRIFVLRESGVCGGIAMISVLDERVVFVEV